MIRERLTCLLKGLILLAIAALVGLLVCISSALPKADRYWIDRLEQPDWPATAAGLGPASLRIEVQATTIIDVCPTDPFECDEVTLEPGSWVIYLVVLPDEIWHVRVH